MASTTFSVSAAYDKVAYNAGEVMTITLSGNAVFVGDATSTSSQSGTLDLTVTADNGAITHVAAPSVTITTTVPPVSQTLNVVLSNVADTSGRAWVIQPGGKSAKATA